MDTNNDIVKGWAVYETADDDPANRKYFLSLSSAADYCDRHRGRAEMTIQPQYFRIERAEDLNGSRLRRAAPTTVWERG